MKKLSNLLQWIDNHIVHILLTIFIFLVTLYPKFPLMIVNYTYVAIRIEDLFVGLMVGFFALQLIRKKMKLHTGFLKLFLLFWLSVFVSALLGIFLHKTIPYPNLGFLHSARRIEYMILFFIAASCVQNEKYFNFFIRAFFITTLIVVLYGLGQKFLGFPAVSTMNAEFARGHILTLTPEARIPSTFAGHYDLAAYLVLIMPMLLSFLFALKQNRYFFLFFLALTILIYTASRISFLAYLGSLVLMLVYLRKFKFLIFTLIITGLLFYVTGDLSKRFLKTFQIKQILVNDNTGQVYIPQKITTKELPAGSLYVDLKRLENLPGQTKNNDPIVVTDETRILKDKILNQKLKEATKSGKILTKAERKKLEETIAESIRPIQTVVSDISSATRFQIEWPRAIKAFLKNPLFGTGPSSITEATDNDYLRWLGELGLVGTGLFLFLIGSIGITIWKHLSSTPQPYKTFYLGFGFGTIGLLANATYIDVFEASKVAFNFWILSGLFIGLLYSQAHTSYEKRKAK